MRKRSKFFEMGVIWIFSDYSNLFVHKFHLGTYKHIMAMLPPIEYTHGRNICQCEVLRCFLSPPPILRKKSCSPSNPVLFCFVLFLTNFMSLSDIEKQNLHSPLPQINNFLSLSPCISINLSLRWQNTRLRDERDINVYNQFWFLSFISISILMNKN